MKCVQQLQLTLRSFSLCLLHALAHSQGGMTLETNRLFVDVNNNVGVEYTLMSTQNRHTRASAQKLLRPRTASLSWSRGSSGGSDSVGPGELRRVAAAGHYGGNCCA